MVVKSGLLLCGKNIDYKRSETECSGKYLGIKT